MLLRVYGQYVKPEDMHFPQTNFDKKGVKKNRTSAFPIQKRCAIIGSGGILLNSSCGKEIDQHDLVIRTNLAAVEGFENDVGRQTNLTSLNGVVVEYIFQEMNDNTTYVKNRKRLSFKKSHLNRIKNLQGSVLWYTLQSSKQKKKLQSLVKELRGSFKTQPPVDRRLRPVSGGCHCLEQ